VKWKTFLVLVEMPTQLTKLLKFKSYGIITIPTNKSETAKLAIKTLIRVLNRLNLAMLNSISKFPNIIGRNMIASIAQNNIPKYIYAKRTVPVAAFVTVSSVHYVNLPEV
jgi:hypothetical protein